MNVNIIYNLMLFANLFIVLFSIYVFYFFGFDFFRSTFILSGLAYMTGVTVGRHLKIIYFKSENGA